MRARRFLMRGRAHYRHRPMTGAHLLAMQERAQCRRRPLAAAQAVGLHPYLEMESPRRLLKLRRPARTNPLPAATAKVAVQRILKRVQRVRRLCF